MTAPERLSFDLLEWLYQDVATAALLDLDATVSVWVAVETALAESQFELGMLDSETLTAIRGLSDARITDEPAFRAAAQNVGYPIVGLVEMLNELLPPAARGYLHLGATTQDIMDSALAVQLRDVGRLLEGRLIAYGDELAGLASRHAATPMAGRTHAHQAVPTTFGLKCAVYLGEATRNLGRLRSAVSSAAIVSLFGAAGTSAALGPHSREVRARVAAKLGLGVTDLPWHVSRDRLAEVAFSCALICASLARLARELIDLSRTEIGEISESDGWHRGASSTMPQKRNPITCEAIVGMSLAAQGSAALMMRAQEAGHERAAGEWQLEWKALPEILRCTGSALSLGTSVLSGLIVNEQAMTRNLVLDHGLVLAEAYMLELARTMGREAAHELVYRAAQLARADDVPLHEALERLAPAAASFPRRPIAPAGYLGEAEQVSHETVAAWQAARDSS